MIIFLQTVQIISGILHTGFINMEKIIMARKDKKMTDDKVKHFACLKFRQR